MKRSLIIASVVAGLSTPLVFGQDNSGRTRDDQMQDQPGRIIIKTEETENAADQTRIRAEGQVREEQDRQARPTAEREITVTERQTTITGERQGTTDARQTEVGEAAAVQAGARADARIDTNETIQAMASGNELEIQLAQHAQQNAQDPQVKQLAETMLRDHQQAKQQIRQLAQQKNVQLSEGKLMDHHQAKLDHFKSKRGAELDAMYAFDQAGDHLKHVLKHQYLSTNAQDQDLRQHALTLLPTLQQHLQQATQVAQDIAGADSSAMPAGGRMEGRLEGEKRMNRTGDNDRTGTGAAGTGAVRGTRDTGRTSDTSVTGPRDQAGDTGTRDNSGAGGGR